ncbi:hypothetical protein [Silvanigrella aquatica]|uniref:Lipoprotein n=1 Tax=Silvanigrella aquatica TaxID=1915309 RepID=A0A1L4CZT8_9BACT|nr:hypothetical protein [Silvanigrella aquatica]APJ03458.1 hypothetical protein AXG55_05885 [Silvanigrella aquatica]
MKKWAIALIALVSISSCGKVTNEDNIGTNNFEMLTLKKKPKSKKYNSYPFSASNETAKISMNVDVNCPNGLPGSNPWIERNLTLGVGSKSGISIIKNKKCYITINSFVNAKSIAYKPVNNPAILEINEIGDAEAGSVKADYISTDASPVTETLYVYAENYELAVIENSPYPIFSTFGIIYSANPSRKIKAQANQTQTVTISIQPMSGNIIKSLTATMVEYSKPTNDWVIDKLDNCKSFTDLCTVTLKFSPKIIYNNNTAELLVSYKDPLGKTQSTRIGFTFSSEK